MHLIEGSQQRVHGGVFALTRKSCLLYLCTVRQGFFAATRHTRVFRQPISDSQPARASGSGYVHEASLEPHEPLSCPGVIDDASEPVVVELTRLLPVAG